MFSQESFVSVNWKIGQEYIPFTIPETISKQVWKMNNSWYVTYFAFRKQECLKSQLLSNME